MTRTNRDNLVYGGIILGSVVFLAWIIPAYTPPYMGYGLRPSLIPSIAVGTILLFAAAALACNALAARKRRADAPRGGGEIKPGDRAHPGRLALFLVPGGLLMPAMHSFGVVPAALGFLLLMQAVYGQRRVLTALLVAGCAAGALYAIMRYVLTVPLP